MDRPLCEYWFGVFDNECRRVATTGTVVGFVGRLSVVSVQECVYYICVASVFVNLVESRLSLGLFADRSVTGCEQTENRLNTDAGRTRRGRIYRHSAASTSEYDHSPPGSVPLLWDLVGQPWRGNGWGGFG